MGALIADEVVREARSGKMAILGLGGKLGGELVFGRNEALGSVHSTPSPKTIQGNKPFRHIGERI